MNKGELRKLYQAKRSALSVGEVEVKSKEICEMLFKNFQFDTISSVHLFLSIKSKKEINTEYIIERFWKDFPSLKIIVPKIDGDDMDSYLLTSETKLEENFLGVPEPVKGIPVAHNQIEMVILPLLAFDQSGNRIGYGKGYYDRFLSTCKPDVLKVGLSLFEAEQVIDVEVFDVPMNFCITPEKIYIF